MGKGDKKTRKGKIFKGSYGKKRPCKNKMRRRKRRSPKAFELIIVESLKANEKKTGTILYNEAIKYKRIQEPNLSASLVNVSAKDEFILTIRDIYKRIKKERVFPILHFEAHGSEDGIHLSNNELVTWEEFFKETRRINLLLGNTLILNLAMCHGLSLIAKITPSKQAPFRAFIGTSGTIPWDKLLEGFEIFYNHFFFTFSGADSVLEVNKELKLDGLRFNYVKAEDFIERFVSIDRNSKFFGSMVNDYAVKEKASNPLYKDVDFKIVLMHTRAKIEHIFNEAASEEEKFLMKDEKGIFYQKKK